MKTLMVMAAVWALSLQAVSGQVNFIFLAEVYGRSVDGIGNFQVQNFSGAVQRGQVVISVKENISRTQVVQIASPVVSLNPGNNSFPVSAYAGSVFRFSATALGSIASQTRNLAPGEYTFCFEFFPSDKSASSEDCFDASIVPIVPINLVNPADEDKICQKRPPLSWLPPVPYPPSMRFRLQLTEKKQGEAVENLMMNTPLVLLDNIPTTTVSYPSFAPDLKEGSTYCWQVVAYQNGLIMSKSEIWEFTVQCTEPDSSGSRDSYRELKTLMNGNYYVATRWLRFSFQNNYNIKKLQYEIYETENEFKKIKNLPDVPIAMGHNKVDIDLRDLDLEEGKHYILKVYPFNEQEISVRFIYHENETAN